MEAITHSVTLDADKCKGCINCIKRCPTEAIRVRNGKAVIMSDHCIDCGECIRICPNHAKKAISDPISIMDNFKYKVALPAPSLYGQFKGNRDANVILTALVNVGFDDIYEVALAAQSVSDYTKEILPGARALLHGPLISSACPVIVKLISIRYPELMDNVLKIITPAELAAVAARAKAVEETGLKPEEIGIFFISPCPAKITALKHRIGYDEPVVDGIFSFTELHKSLLPAVEKIKEPKDLSKAGIRGIEWSYSGGEGSAIGENLFVAVDGIDNVIRVLDEVENDKLSNVRFIELNACPGGCVGGCLAVENPFVARARIQRLGMTMDDSKCNNSVDPELLNSNILNWKNTPECTSILSLDSDRGVAIRKLADIEALYETLPGIDCGSCGAPSCHALAEDVILGTALESDCVFKLRERMGTLFHEMAELQEYMPPPFREIKQ
ncbi:MAG: 4Fe-4S dicluster domain-containing protein [Oscillospiraceae bacterium]|jgi:iron only hydrogenase large subunit-like protein|nr:4Fe-4S dicluster domain-containing protein [Oscillospiraceae bacterium]